MSRAAVWPSVAQLTKEKALNSGFKQVRIPNNFLIFWTSKRPAAAVVVAVVAVVVAAAAAAAAASAFAALVATSILKVRVTNESKNKILH